MEFGTREAFGVRAYSAAFPFRTPLDAIGMLRRKKIAAEYARTPNASRDSDTEAASQPRKRPWNTLFRASLLLRNYAANCFSSDLWMSSYPRALACFLRRPSLCRNTRAS